MKLWSTEQDPLAPTLVDCPNGRYPAVDEYGRSVCINTHFDTEGEAWEHLIRDAEAWISLVARRVRNAKQTLGEANVEAGNAAEHYAAIKEAFKKFEANKVKP